MRDSEVVLNIRKEISKVIIGQEKVVDAVIRAILVGGHVLIEGVPGLAKTALIRAFAQIMDCEFKRIQFTIDLLPSDIIGINSFDPQKKIYKIIKGPLFTNLLLADEINRASPKVQSALLEAMAEKQVTVGIESLNLPRPFFVFATQNSIESLGTYPLPQAQLDRFVTKVLIDYLSPENEKEMLSMDMSEERFDKMKKILTPKEILELNKKVEHIFVSDPIKEYIVTIVDATRFPNKYGIKSGEFIEIGCGPRASLALLNIAKAEAFLNQRDYVIPQDIKEVVHDILRHRIQINYLGQAKNIDSDKVIKEILLKIKVP
jgi:MoxR-like ATPase